MELVCARSGTAGTLALELIFPTTQVSVNVVGVVDGVERRTRTGVNISCLAAERFTEL